jgi:hypothetical protein
MQKERTQKQAGGLTKKSNTRLIASTLKENKPKVVSKIKVDGSYLSYIAMHNHFSTNVNAPLFLSQNLNEYLSQDPDKVADFLLSNGKINSNWNVVICPDIKIDSPREDRPGFYGEVDIDQKHNLRIQFHQAANPAIAKESAHKRYEDLNYRFQLQTRGTQKKGV